jgi:octaprenyl-diphosphate synthase
LDSDSAFLKRFKLPLKEIDRELKRGFVSGVPMMDDIGRHSLLSQGKRLRPLLFVLSSMLCGYKGEEVYFYSTIFEYLHCASLLHDDVIDNAELRRNKPSARSLWGNSAAVLTGDYLTSRAMAYAVKTGNIGFLKMLVETGQRMAEGQFLELVHTNDLSTGKDRYMEIIISKTAELMSAACACGGIIAGAGEEEIQRLKGFGLNQGIAFQLMDDLLDYSSSEEELGKPSGKDLREGKTTLPLIYALSGMDAAEAKRVERLFADPKPDEGDYGRMLMKVKGSGAIERVREEARSYIDRASEFLAPFPGSSLKEDLLFLNDYITSRHY